jgi:hypothetical protein
VPLSKKGLPTAEIRDNLPASDGALEKCLQDGLLPADWYEILNRRTFFWVQNARLRGLLGARAYRNKPQTVLTVDTASLVKKHASQIELCRINSGSTIYTPVARGLKTFLRINEYDYEHWRKTKGKRNALAELTVKHSVPDIRDHVLAVHDWKEGQFHEIWRRPGVSSHIGP